MEGRARFLVVDDEEESLAGIARILKGENILIETETSAQGGIKKLRESRFDVVITDLMMPGMDGLEFIDHIRQEHPWARIVMITGYASLRTAMQALNKGAFDYIAKPYTREELVSVAIRAVRHGPMAGTREKQPDEDRKDPTAPGRYYSLRGHTWARIEPDGTVAIGMETEMSRNVGEIKSIEVLPIGEKTFQGQPCAGIFAADGRVHKLLAPFSGGILAVNAQLIADPKSGCGERGDCWLIKIEPTGIESEIENVTSV